MKALKSLLIAFGVGVLALQGCAASQQAKKPEVHESAEDRARRAREQEIMRVLGIQSRANLQYLGEGYAISRFSEASLRTLAGVYSGELQVRRTPNGYVVTGNLIGMFLTTANPYVKRVVVEADDGDKILTQRELLGLTKRVLEEYAR